MPSLKIYGFRLQRWIKVPSMLDVLIFGRLPLKSANNFVPTVLCSCYAAVTVLLISSSLTIFL